MVRAHVVSWILHNGIIPDGLHVCHNCPGGDNSMCVNPNHLWLGSHQDNMHDKVMKGRAQHGEQHGMSKLSNAQVIRAFQLRAEGMTGKEIASILNVHFSTIYRVFSRTSWKHFTGFLPQPE
jgi:hypothetical protein